MQENQSNSSDHKEKFQIPAGSSRTDTLTINNGQSLEYQAIADWIILYKEEKPCAQMFYTAYFKKTAEPKRCITFVFNGGPGSSSVYLHIGALGAKIVHFHDDGTIPKPPVQVVDNPDTWLTMTDLVFIDPVGTGFSRRIDQGQDDNKQTKEHKKEYYKLKRDLESIAEFMQAILSRYQRWDSPCFIAGESYGGYRVGKLAKLLQMDYGIGLNGVIIISPALEFAPLYSSDYDVIPWLDTFPTMAATAVFHHKSKFFKPGADLDEVRQKAELFAVEHLSRLLILGDQLSDAETVIKKTADMIGLSRAIVRENRGRINVDLFIRELLKSEQKACGRYDATITAIDPFPDREKYEGPDPTLFALNRIFMAGINTQLRKNIGLKTDKEYQLFSLEANESWEIDIREDTFQGQIGSTDDLRYGMSINPDMKVFICHGYFDLITPYYSANRLIQNMKLTEEQKKNLTVRHFSGGHMFYTWAESRSQFKLAMEKFYLAATD